MDVRTGHARRFWSTLADTTIGSPDFGADQPRQIPPLHARDRFRHQGSHRVAASLIALGVVLAIVSAYCYEIHRQNDRYLLKASAFIFDGPGDDESKAIALSHFVAMEGMQAVASDSASMNRSGRTRPSFG